MFILSEIAFWLPMIVSLQFLPNHEKDLGFFLLNILTVFVNFSYMLINNINNLNWIYADIRGVSRACVLIRKLRVYVFFQIILGK